MVLVIMNMQQIAVMIIMLTLCYLGWVINMNHDEDYAPDVNYGNRFPDDWYWYDDDDSED